MKTEKDSLPISVTHPELARQWSERNYPFTPEDETADSYSAVWWRCELGHEWQAVIRRRVSRGSGCPYCTGRRIYPGFNDLKTKRPDILPYWSGKNGDLMPDQVGPGSGRKVWWKCERGHEFRMAAVNFCREPVCPVCASENVIPGVSDIMTLYPEAAAEWDHEKNPPPGPEGTGVIRAMRRWRCPACNGSYSRPVYIQMRMKENRCPYCTGKKVLSGLNDLQTLFPELADEWDREKNRKGPSEILWNSWNTVWWRCAQGHSWSAPVKDRTVKGRSCPYCDGSVQEERPAVADRPVPPSMRRYRNKKYLLRPEEISEYYSDAGMMVTAMGIQKHEDNVYDIGELPVWKKPSLSLYEAVKLYPISLRKLRKIIEKDRSAGWLAYRGGYLRIIREEFDRYLDGINDVMEVIDVTAVGAGGHSSETL